MAHEEDMGRAFPVMEELKAALPDRPDVRDCFTLPCRKSLAWNIMLYYIVLYYLIPYCAILCYIILYYILSYHIIFYYK